MIEFRVNEKKALEAIVYLAKQQPRIDHYHIVKIIFFADKSHLNKYGRPIIGDKYIKMPYGPAPSFTLDVIKMIPSYTVSNELIEEASRSFSVVQEGSRKLIEALREPDIDEFSDSDIECLNEALVLWKDKTFEEICDITHEDKAWLKARKNGRMDYSLLLDDDNPAKNDIISDLLENSKAMVF